MRSPTTTNHRVSFSFKPRRFCPHSAKAHGHLEWLRGGGRDTGAPHGSSAFQLYYAKALASWYPRSDLEIDLNLGAANAYGAGTFTLAGAAIQYAVINNVQLLAEAFCDEPGSTKYQVGARYIIVPDRLEAYASYGNRFNASSGQWSVIIGIRVQTGAFLP